MKEMYRVWLVGPQDGKPQKGLVTWFTFVHPGEERSEELGRTLARRLTERTGHQVSYQVEPISFVERDEGDLLAMVDELVDLFPDAVDQPRTIVKATTIQPKDALPATVGGRDLAGQFVDELRDLHAIDLDDWLLVGEILEDGYAPDTREAVISLSLPAAQAGRLLANETLVASYRLEEDDGSSAGSLYDDDARMEEILADAEDAALHAWGPLGSPQRRANPHPSGTEEAIYWDNSFWSAYARENGK